MRVASSAGTGRSRAIGTCAAGRPGLSSGRCRWSRGEAGWWRGIWLSCWRCTGGRQGGERGQRGAGHSGMGLGELSEEHCCGRDGMVVRGWRGTGRGAPEWPAGSTSRGPASVPRLRTGTSRPPLPAMGVPSGIWAPSQAEPCPTKGQRCEAAQLHPTCPGPPCHTQAALKGLAWGTWGGLLPQWDPDRGARRRASCERQSQAGFKKGSGGSPMAHSPRNPHSRSAPSPRGKGDPESCTGPSSWGMLLPAWVGNKAWAPPSSRTLEQKQPGARRGGTDGTSSLPSSNPKHEVLSVCGVLAMHTCGGGVCYSHRPEGVWAKAQACAKCHQRWGEQQADPTPEAPHQCPQTRRVTIPGP